MVHLLDFSDVVGVLVRWILYPLSFFCLAEEVFSRGLVDLVNSGKVKPISSSRRVTAPSHILYADDIMVFCKGDKCSLMNVMHFIEEYGVNSHQCISKGKSRIFIGK